MIIYPELSKRDTLRINMTLQELYLLSVWITTNLDSSTKIKIIQEGCDVVDYYVTEVVFSKFENVVDRVKMKEQLVKFITSLTQESNFGGIGRNEHWISYEDVFHFNFLPIKNDNKKLRRKNSR